MILAVPAAGVSAVGPAPDCEDHETTTTSHQDHGNHAGQDAGAGPDDVQCDCPCGGLDCSTGLSLEVAPEFPDHGAPAAGWTDTTAPDGMTAAAPDTPFRPPIFA